MAMADPKMVMELYRLTGMPVMACKAALEEAGWEMAKAIEALQWITRSKHSCHHASPEFWDQFRPQPPTTAEDPGQ